MKKVDERTLDYYMKEEGISASSVTVVDGVEIKSDDKQSLEYEQSKYLKIGISQLLKIILNM